MQYDNAQAMMKQQLNMLKYIMDYPAEKEIALTPVNTDSITTVALTGLSENIYELQLSQSQVQLAERQKKIITNGYIPSLSLTGSRRYAAYTDKGYHWFHSGPSNQWFSFLWSGANLCVFRFSTDWIKTYKIKKAMIDIENKRLAWEDARKNLQTQYLNAVNDLMNNQRNFKKQKDNYLLAEDVYAVTSDRYREGIASMTEVLQDEMQMSEAKTTISAHYNYRVTNLMLLKLTGQIESLVK